MSAIIHRDDFPHLRWVCSAHPTERKILDFELLEVGWHFGNEGRRFTRCAVEESLELHLQLLSAGFSQTDAFPGLNGEIQVTAYSEEDYYEFTREADGFWTFVHEKSGEEVACREQLNREKVRELLETLCPRLCNTFVFYRGTIIGTGETNASVPWHSSLPAQMAESPFLSVAVVSTPPVRFATTSVDFIPWYPENPPSSGASPAIESLAHCG